MDPRLGREVRAKTQLTVPVVYYLSRNRRLEHPHLVEVPFSSPNGLYLRDFLLRIKSLRGHATADMYSWSSKRRYKNGYVWQDLTENDIIPPSHGNDYILKGSELCYSSLNLIPDEIAFPTRENLNINSRSGTEDNKEYEVYKGVNEEGWHEGYSNMGTQTVDAKAVGTLDGEGAVGSVGTRLRSCVNDRPSARFKPSEALIQLIGCGARKMEDCDL